MCISNESEKSTRRSLDKTQNSKVLHEMINSVRNYLYILTDSAYDGSDMYDCSRMYLILLLSIPIRGEIWFQINWLVNRSISIELRKNILCWIP